MEIGEDLDSVNAQAQEDDAVREGGQCFHSIFDRSVTLFRYVPADVNQSVLVSLNLVGKVEKHRGVFCNFGPTGGVLLSTVNLKKISRGS